MNNADTVIVLDFETTGLSPNQGDRAIEIGAVLLENGEITDRFQKLMNPGFRINSFIENYTGITNEMLVGAPSCEEVMTEFAGFAKSHTLVAHNASFDRRVMVSEYGYIGYETPPLFICSMLAARRLYRDAPNHRLETLVRHAGVQIKGDFHRALADAEMTAGLWNGMLGILRDSYGITSVPGELMMKITKKKREKVHDFLESYAEKRK